MRVATGTIPDYMHWVIAMRLLRRQSYLPALAKARRRPLDGAGPARHSMNSRTGVTPSRSAQDQSRAPVVGAPPADPSISCEACARAPTTEPLGDRLETFFIGLCVAVGQFDGRPFSAARIVANMRVPRTAVVRSPSRLEDWGLIYRQGHHFYCAKIRSVNGMQSYQQVRVHEG